jgi:[ribosomal protein S5]-alanine N-acetyltransferase
MTAIRLLTPDDAPRLAELLRRSREHLAPWDPWRPSSWFTPDGQAVAVREALEGHRDGVTVPLAVLDPAGEVVGRLTLQHIVRGAAQSCSVGYWLDRDATGQGLMTRALTEALDAAYGPLGLHRVQADLLPSNGASRRVLERVGFYRIGRAPRMLRISGRWQDCDIYQRLADDPNPDGTDVPGA